MPLGWDVSEFSRWKCFKSSAYSAYVHVTRGTASRVAFLHRFLVFDVDYAVRGNFISRKNVKWVVENSELGV